MDILRLLRPSLWFAAHLHTKFAAVIPHFEEVNSGGSGVHNSSGDSASAAGDVGWGIDRDKDDKNAAGGNIYGGNTYGGAPVEFCRPTGTQCIATTKFLALDKCLPGRDFLQIVDVPIPTHRDNTAAIARDNSTSSGGTGHGTGTGPPLPPTPPPRLQYDPEWLAILRRTHTLLSTSRGNVKMPAMVEPCSEGEIQEAGSIHPSTPPPSSSLNVHSIDRLTPTPLSFLFSYV